MGGLLSLINDVRLNKGLPSLGFVTPRLYQIARDHPGEAFYDIAEGNIRCSSAGFCCDTGFVAAEGWDAATGLGYPIFTGLLKYLSSDDF
jgi:tripeptidyl-peptidase I